MKLVSNKKSKTVFLTSYSKISSLDHKNINIIVSPQFYWVRKFEIPVKSPKQARLILPTLFEDIIEGNIQELTYQVKKIEDNLYLCFAFNNSKIFEAIKNSGINISKIDSIYFAQTECKDIKSFSADNQNFIYTSDDILVQLPKGISANSSLIENEIDKINLSSFKMDMKFYNSSILSSKNLKFIYMFFIVLASLNFLKYISYSKEYSKTEDQIEKIKKISTLPSSMIQTNSIIKKYKGAIETENKKRELINYLLSNGDLNLDSFELDKKMLIFRFINKNRTKTENFIKKDTKFQQVKSCQII
ncbi:hypothetical protein [Halarcobacter anaerophilus]|uniref:hypothetical protein n=1 Tax=Halarcobacter anaerophilus TaxID=877500 RepID=UPI0005C81A0B|nr:hypothetical protein [Halarcobacter anaerophilus]